MKVANLEQVEKSFGLDKTKPNTRRVLFYLAVGDVDSEYAFDFLGNAIYDFLRDPKVPQVDKLALLGNLNMVTVHDRDMHQYRLKSLGLRQPLYHDWVQSPSSSCESSKDETRTLGEPAGPGYIVFSGFYPLGLQGKLNLAK